MNSGDISEEASALLVSSDGSFFNDARPVNNQSLYEKEQPITDKKVHSLMIKRQVPVRDRNPAASRFYFSSIIEKKMGLNHCFSALSTCFI